MRKMLFLFTLSLVLHLNIMAQDPLQTYIDTALQQNLQLEQRELFYRQQMARLREANAQMLPSVSVQARLSMARGGRAIIIPVGDLVNPVYNNLNVLNQFGGQLSDTYPDFPPYPGIANVQENFLRRQEQETILRLQAPVYNPAVLANRRIQNHQLNAVAADVYGYRRQLVRDVKKAYFTYWSAREGLALYENTLALVKENLRTTQSLYDNHQTTLDEVLSAEARVREMEQQLAVALQQEQSAKAYFNFLLNRPLTAHIQRSEADLAYVGEKTLLHARQSIRQREELEQFEETIQATEEVVQLRKSAFLPTVSVQADYGVQGVDYRLDDQSDFFLGSLVLSWTLFDQSARRKVEQAALDVDRLRKQESEIRSQLELQVIDAWYAMDAARKQTEQAKAEVSASRRAYLLVDKKYRQGQANVLERSQARTQMTNAEARLILAKNDLQIRSAELEYATASFPIQK